MVKDPLLSGKPGIVEFVQVPAMTYLAIEGQGAPGDAAYRLAVGALYPLAYGARFAGKVRGIDEKVGPLEGLWWADDMTAFLSGRREDWRWRMMIRAPSWLDEVAFQGLRVAARQKKAMDSARIAALDQVALTTLDEGACVQALHVGPYADEGPLIQRMHAEAAARGRALRGRHHEIYLSDPERVAPERLKTILRQPVT